MCSNTQASVVIAPPHAADSPALWEKSLSAAVNVHRHVTVVSEQRSLSTVGEEFSQTAIRTISAARGKTTVTKMILTDKYV